MRSCFFHCVTCIVVLMFSLQAHNPLVHSYYFVVRYRRYAMLFNALAIGSLFVVPGYSHDFGKVGADKG